MSVSTVRVKSSHSDHEQGFYVINESDFDASKHELWADGPLPQMIAQRREQISEEQRAEAKREEAMKAAAAIKAAQVNSAKPVLGIAAGRDDRNK